MERAAKDVSVSITQTVAAANTVRPHLPDTDIAEELIRECAETSRHVPLLVQRIKESQTATTPGEQFKAHSGLIHDAQGIVRPASRLIEQARNAIPAVQDKHSAVVPHFFVDNFLFM